jgi:hypothetical protein
MHEETMMSEHICVGVWCVVCVFFECSKLNIFVIRSILCSVNNILNCYVIAPGAYVIYLLHPNFFTQRGTSKPIFCTDGFIKFLCCCIKNAHD